MGRLDLPDVYRDEDYYWPNDDSSPTGRGFSVDSPLMVPTAGDSIVRGTTEEPEDV